MLFFAAAVGACLFWTAACVAAAARTERRWLRRLLAAVGMFLPSILVLPWVGLTGSLAAIARDVHERQAGLFGSLTLPALGGTLQTPITAAATHRAAEVLVAATRFRIASLYRRAGGRSKSPVRSRHTQWMWLARLPSASGCTFTNSITKVGPSTR